MCVSILPLQLLQLLQLCSSAATAAIAATSGLAAIAAVAAIAAIAKKTVHFPKIKHTCNYILLEVVINSKHFLMK